MRWLTIYTGRQAWAAAFHEGTGRRSPCPIYAFPPLHGRKTVQALAQWGTDQAPSRCFPPEAKRFPLPGSEVVATTCKPSQREYARQATMASKGWFKRPNWVGEEVSHTTDITGLNSSSSSMVGHGLSAQLHFVSSKVKSMVLMICFNGVPERKKLLMPRPWDLERKWELVLRPSAGGCPA